MTDNKHVNYEPPEGKLLSAHLMDTFNWAKTTKGPHYWADVYFNIREIEEDNKQPSTDKE